jgi:hypothetical protein
VRASLAIALCGACLASCLNGNAEPIVRLPGGSTVEDGAPAAAGDGGAGRCDPASPLVLHYDNQQVATDATGIDFLFKVTNATGASLALSSLAIRYYFTSEIAPPGAISVYYADTCCGNSRSGFTADVHVSANVMPPTPTADHYLETTFDAAAGELADGDNVQIEVGFHAPGFGQSLDQSNDYSFIASATGTQAQWDQCPTQCALFNSCVMTVYEDGVLVWGTPP